MFKVTQLSGFGAGGNFDTVDPVFVSAATALVDGNTTLAFTIELDEPCTIVLSGADASEFELASPSALSATHTLRWSSNGVRDYDSPQDTDTDNIYEVTLTATDASSNQSVQNLEVEVDFNWVTAFGPYTVSSAGFSDGNYTIRIVVPASLITVGGTSCRLTFQPAEVDGHDTPIAACYIGEQASSGDNIDMAVSPAPVQVTVNGSGSFTLEGDTFDREDVNSDTIAFAIDETKNYVVAFNINASWYDVTNTGATGVTSRVRSGAQEAATADVSAGSYTQVSNKIHFIKKMSVATPTST
jgi:hypothetical protein